jgi:hypothetical protein
VDQLAQGSQVFGPLPRVLAAVSSAGGALAIVAGAVWSVGRVWRRGAPRRLLWSNGLIALGTLILGASGTLNSVFGAMTAFAVTLLVGISVIFAGFLVASASGSGRSRVAADAAAPIEPAPPWRPPVRTAAPSQS